MSGMAQASGASRAVEVGSAILFASAAGYSCLLVIGPQGGIAGAAAGFLGAILVLGRIDDRPSFTVPAFEPVPIVPVAADELPELLLTELAELLLTDALKLPHEGPDELLLEDRIDAPADDARVIRLFDPRLLGTAGEMHGRVASHLRDQQESRHPDATAELHQALTALRKSLR